MSTIRPLEDNILVKLVEAEEQAENKTDSGIYLPDTAQKDEPQAHEGVVIEIGDSDKIKVEKDDKVIVSKYVGTKVAMDGEEYLLVKNNDILAIIE